MSESLRLPWRDERPRSSGHSGEQDAATSSDAEHDAKEKSFIVHKVGLPCAAYYAACAHDSSIQTLLHHSLQTAFQVQRHDTLAGIAIKYSVPVRACRMGVLCHKQSTVTHLVF